MYDIDVYGYIASEKWADSDVRAKDFIEALRKADGQDVTIHINSGGGDTMEAAAMAEAIRTYKGHTTASIEGLAASAASYFALCADEVVMNPYAFFMIHNPSGICAGTSADMRETAGLLDKVRGSISAQYVKKTGRRTEEIEALMDKETWLTAEEAQLYGFVDALTDAEPIAACVDSKTFARYHNAPLNLIKKEEEEEEAEQETEEEQEETEQEETEEPSEAPEETEKEIEEEPEQEEPEQEEPEEEDEPDKKKKAGDNGSTITSDNHSDVGATKDEVEATSKVVCVNGQFLYIKEN